MKKIVKAILEKSPKKHLIPYNLGLRISLQKSGLVSFLIIVLCHFSKTNKSLEPFSSYGVSNRQASLRGTFTLWVQQIDIVLKTTYKCLMTI